MNGQQSDTYNIMLARLETTPLKIIYAGRLEYARKGGPPMNDFILHLPFWNSFPWDWEVNSFPELQNIRVGSCLLLPRANPYFCALKI
jgi:hypothetical protein